MNHYNTLGISPSASHEEIKKAFRKLSIEFHPDKTGGDDSRFKDINEAYRVIGDTEKRKAYDLSWSKKPVEHLPTVAEEVTEAYLAGC